MVGTERLVKLVRNISLARMTHQSQIVDLSIREMNENPSVYSHWMAIILVSGPPAKITFKTHFKTRFAQAMAAKAFDRPAESVGTEQAIDFMREFCNLSAGAIKASLLNNQIKLALSLPIVTRGFDEVFFSALNSQGTLMDHWRLVSGDTEVICSVTIDCFQPVDFSKVDPNFTDESEVEVF